MTTVPRSAAAWLMPDEQSGHAEFFHGSEEDVGAGIYRATRTDHPFETVQLIAQKELRLK
jgi:hypothetical protein